MTTLVFLWQRQMRREEDYGVLWLLIAKCRKAGSLLDNLNKIENPAMTQRLNRFGQPIGAPVPGWTPPPYPPCEPMQGRFCRLEPLDTQRHAAALYDANGLDEDGRNWTYLPYGPFGSFESYRAWLDGVSRGADPMFFTIIKEPEDTPAGVASYLRITPSSGSIEVGHIHYSEKLKATPAATEAMFLMMQGAFELGYRRYEWKCDALNAASRWAAQRLGFSYEGIFRQATVYKERNRDTAWYAATDAEWPELRQAFSQWLAPNNFDERGGQRISLSELTRPILKKRG